MAARQRLDAELAARGLVDSREQGRRLVLAGEVRVNGVPAAKPGQAVSADDVLEVSPLLPEAEWDWFCLDHVPYHGRVVTVIWDRDGKRYGRGAGLQVLVDGVRAGGAERLETVRVMMPSGGR